MTIDNNHTPKTRWQLPTLKSSWWTALLGLSLMLNLLIGGMAIGRHFRDGPNDRLMGVSYVQLIPRRFIQELPKQRRKALMDIIHQHRPDLRNLRNESESNGQKLADVLENQNFNIEDVRSTVKDFATGTESLAARGGDVVVQIVQQLTAEERKTLAQTIRDRAGKNRK